MRPAGSILVVDQEPTIVNLLVEILTDEGYIVSAAPDSARALAALARHPPTLLLLDVPAHKLNSADLITQVREIGPATMPIVLMTTAPRKVTALLVPGTITCLAKPFDIDELLACVAQYVPRQ